MKRASKICQLRASALAGLFILSLFSLAQATTNLETTAVSHEPVSELARRLVVGDVVFTHVRPLPFKKVSEATQSWANHVGVVVDVSGDEPIIAESTFPFSRTTTLSKFLARSENGRVAVSRLKTPLTEEQKRNIRDASTRRLGIYYDTGFNLHSNGQFCSRFVREVLSEATRIKVGDVETFQTLLTKNPNTDMSFWRFWYFGDIPWQRQTVTPASLLQSAHLHKVFDGYSN